MKAGVILDFDGVIIDSKEVQEKAFKKSYEWVTGRTDPPFKEFLSHSGDSLANILRKMNLPLEMLELYRCISRENIHKIKIHDGMKTLLRDLRTIGFKIGLCTGKDRERTVEILEKLRLTDYFDNIVCSDDVKNPKPHAESLILAIKNLNLNKQRTVMVGDAKNDIQCAKNAKIKSIAVTWGDNERSVLESASPDYIADNTNELYRYILEATNCNLLAETMKKREIGI